MVLGKRHFAAWLDHDRWIESSTALYGVTYWCRVYARQHARQHMRQHARQVSACFAKLLDTRLLSDANRRVLERDLELMRRVVDVHSMRNIVLITHRAPCAEPLHLDVYIESLLITWSSEHVLTLARDVADVLQSLEERGIAHRGLHPGRTLVTDGRHVFVSDYHGCVSRYHLAGGVVGEPPYAAPELHELRSYDPRRCDAWSVGALILYAGARAAHGGPTKGVTWGSTWASCCSRAACFTPAYGQRVIDFSAIAARAIPLGRVARRCLIERPSADCLARWLVPCS